MASIIIRMRSALSPKILWPEVSGNTDYCPWVRIGNLYASVTFTGNESWMPLVKTLYGFGQKEFVIMTGRHGDQMGQQVDPHNKFEPRNPKDEAINPTGDEQSAKSLRGALRDVQIEVMDVGNGGYDNVGLLRAAIGKHLSQNKVVILSWCYSLYAMKSGWSSALKEVWPEIWKAADMIPIYWTARDWAWVLQYPTTLASEKAAETARQ
jgi:hypothetical protein